MLYPSELLARNGRPSTLAEGAKRGNVTERLYSIRYVYSIGMNGGASGHSKEWQAGSSFRAISDFLGEFFNFLGPAQHGDGKNQNGIGFFHLGFQFAGQVVKLLDVFLDFLLVSLKDEFRIELRRSRLLLFWLRGILRVLAASLRA